MNKNQKNRYSGRYNNRGNKPQMIFRNTALDSSGPCGKYHGTALQLFEKYQAAAKDANLQNDTVLTETCLQYADHYMRLQNQAIANEESLKAKQNPPPRAAHSMAQATDSTDELPDFGLPAEEGISSEELSEEDKALKEMDLSIPISAIQEKHTDTPRRKKSSPKPNKPREEVAH